MFLMNITAINVNPMRLWSSNGRMNQRPAPLLCGPCQKSSPHFQDHSCPALCVSGEVGVAEPRIDRINDNKWVCVGGPLSNFSSCKKLEEFGDWVATFT